MTMTASKTLELNPDHPVIFEVYKKVKADPDDKSAKETASLLTQAAIIASGSELKGSVGEGPNHSNYSDRSSVRIIAKFRNFR